MTSYNPCLLLQLAILMLLMTKNMSSLISSAKRKAMSFSLQHGFKNTLLVATRTDPASINIANSLIGKYDWKELLSENGNSILQAKTYDPSNNLFLWIVNQRLLHLNHPDVHFQTALTQSIESPPEIDEVLFLSRHQAASGQLSLTVHPIGVPWVTDVTDVGGLPGRCSPPNPRISSLYRSIMERTKEQGLSDTFQVTLEATHHGPHVDKPTCFVEIGSTESEWSNTEAGMVWADCLADQFSICCKDGNTVDESPISEEAIDQRMKLVAISIGGGHYVPKLNDMARFGDGFYIGHALASYTLQEHLDDDLKDEDEAQSPDGSRISWKTIIDEAISSTRITFPEEDSKLLCLVDKKAFNGKHRGMITSYLDERSIEWTFKTADIKKIYQSIISNE